MSAILHPIPVSQGDATTAVRYAGGGRRVLVVDDSRVQRRILAASLKRWGYEVAEAGSAGEALTHLRTHSVEIILSDWMMPEMDGLDFCRELRTLHLDKYVYFILFTSKTEKEEVAHGLDAGADDFLTKPVNSDELRARIAAGERILSMAGELTEKNDLLSSTLSELRSIYNSLDRDLREARKLQQSLIPDRVRVFGRVEIASLFRPSGHVGGDLVGFFPVSDTQLGVYAIDVSGHGVASALMTARLAGYLGGASPEQNVALMTDGNGTARMRSPSDVCELLNNSLLQEMETDLYFTMVLAQLDLETGLFRFAQAGHPRPALQKAAGGVEFLGDGGFPIGLVPGATWDTFETRLGAGDRVFLYSDGLTEAIDRHGRMLDEQGLARLLERHRRLPGTKLLETLVEDLDELSGGHFGDDVSGVLLRLADPA